MSPTSLTSAHQQFEAALPAIQRSAGYYFRHRRRQREDLLAEAVGCAWKAWHNLVERGRDPVAVGITAIAAWAARHALNGRRIGNRNSGRGAMDVLHRRARAKRQYRVVSYHSEPAAWTDWLTMDNRVSPADEAAFRIDFSEWMAGLPQRRRITAELLAQGFGTLEVAQAVGLTPAAISQARTWLAESWKRFQGEIQLAPV
jgi:hypothetical protein